MDIQTFNFNVLPVRIVMIDDAPWFVAVDVALILGYASTKDATRLLDDDEKGGHILPTPGGAQEFTVINESGLFNLVLRSRRDEARPFRKWVTGEVLPAIRRTGSYTLAPAAPALDISDPLVLAKQFIRAETERRALSAQVETLTPKAEVYDALVSSEGSYSMSEAAKILGGTGEIRLFRLLRERGTLMNAAISGAEHHNVPYQRYINAGYFEVVTRPRPGGEGRPDRVSYTTRVTARGLAWLQRGMAAQNLQLERPA